MWLLLWMNVTVRSRLRPKKDIKGFFHNSLWYGFTGTPIFKENKRKQLGDLAQTTHQQYGERLHEYTVKEAIHDGAVLALKWTIVIPLFRRFLKKTFLTLSMKIKSTC